MDLDKHTILGGARALPPPRLAPLRTSRGALQGGARAQSSIFLPFLGNLVPAGLTAATPAIYMGYRPVHSGWSGVVDAFDMYIENLTLRGGAPAMDFEKHTPRGEARAPPLPRLALLRTSRGAHQGGARAQPSIFLPFLGNLVPAGLTAASPATYMGCRPVHSGWSGVVDAFDM